MHEGDRSNPEFSLTRGGPLFALLTSIGLGGTGTRDALRRSLAFAAVTWGPLAILAIAHWFSAGTPDPVARDPAVHVRLLVAIPLFFEAERLLEERCASSYRRLVEGHVRRPEIAASIARRAERLRDAWLVEATMLVIGLSFGLSLWLGMTTGSGALKGVDTSPIHSASLAWYALVGLPVFQFLLLRSLYRWAIWSGMLVRLSRIELHLVPTHPDLAGGLGELSEPVQSFAVIALAGAAVVAATWGYRVALQGIDLKVFTSPFVLLATFFLALAFAPLCFFTPRLVRARIVGLRRYSLFALRYTKLFQEKWLGEPNDESLLASPDIQGLADLGASFEKLEHMRPVPFGPRPAILVFVATFAPMVPVLAMVRPIPELLTSLGRAVLGLPH